MRVLICYFILIFYSSFPTYGSDIVKLFSNNLAFSNVKISPDGTYLAVIMEDGDKQALGFIKRHSMEAVSKFTLPLGNEIGNFFWANNERVVIKLAQTVPWNKTPVYYGELFAVNINGRRGRMIYGYRAGSTQLDGNMRKIESTYGWADILHILPDNDRQILISSTTMSEAQDARPNVMLLDIYNGKTRHITKAPGSYASFLTDRDGQLVLTESITSQRKTEVHLYNQQNNSWTKLPEQSYGTNFSAVGVLDDGKSVYVLDNYQQDKVGLFKLSLDGSSYQRVYANDTVDISSLITTSDTNQVFAIRTDNGFPSYAFLKQQYTEAEIFKYLLQLLDGGALRITSKTKDGKLWVVHRYADTNPGEYFLFDLESEQLKRLFYSMPDLINQVMSPMIPFTFKSFDGMQLHGYFTEGVGQKERKPLIINVHGGPHGTRDRWQFDPEVQLLASKGYSVLQVNYRGSGGYGTEYQNAGYLQWGDAIQQDIIAATKWAIAEKKAMPDNICIMGGSFGGYSAVQSAILAPELFQCVVAVAGVYDLNLMKSSGDIPLKSYGIAYLEQVLGTDAEQLWQYSPVNHVTKLKAPILLAHGKHDKRAPIIQAERLKAALDKAGKQYQWLEFNDEMHGFYSPYNREIYYRNLLNFLEQHLRH